MGILKPAENTMAYFKCGIFGFQGSGKTYTATDIAIGMCNHINVTKLCYLDTETGSDFMLNKLKEKGFDVFQVKSRAFSDLLETVRECEKDGVFLIIDSLTHIWRDLMSSYDKKLNRNGRLQFQDWARIKGEWQEYTDLFVNSRVHIIACGRAGYDYDYDVNDDGTKDLIKTGTKFKAEGEFGFEPSLVIEMERLSENHIEIENIDSSTRKGRDQKRTFQPKIGSQSVHRMHILKDRTDTINGMHFDYYRGCGRSPFEDISKHVANLNIGGEHLGYGDKDSSDRFDNDGYSNKAKAKRRATIALEEVRGFLDKHTPATGKADQKAARQSLLEHVFGTVSSTKMEGMGFDVLESGLARLRTIINVPENTLENIAKGEILEPPPEDIPDVGDLNV